MVSNFERIYKEIKYQAARLEREHGLPAEGLTNLCMEIVDAEDQHRIKAFNVNQQMENMIDQAAKRLISRENL